MDRSFESLRNGRCPPRPGWPSDERHPLSSTAIGWRRSTPTALSSWPVSRAAAVSPSRPSRRVRVPPLLDTPCRSPRRHGVPVLHCSFHGVLRHLWARAPAPATPDAQSGWGGVVRTPNHPTTTTAERPCLDGASDRDRRAVWPLPCSSAPRRGRPTRPVGHHAAAWRGGGCGRSPRPQRSLLARRCPLDGPLVVAAMQGQRCCVVCHGGERVSRTVCCTSSSSPLPRLCFWPAVSAASPAAPLAERRHGAGAPA